MGIFGWNGARDLPPLDGDHGDHGDHGGDDENTRRDDLNERLAQVGREEEQLFSALFSLGAHDGRGPSDEYAGFFRALVTHLLVLLGQPSWWTRYTPAQRREAEGLILAHSAPLLAEVDALSGALRSTWLDDQCVYCRRVLAEHGEPLPEVEWEFRAHGGYVCAAHLPRLSAHTEACAVIDELLTPRPGAPRYGSVEIANRYRWGYLGERLADDQPFP